MVTSFIFYLLIWHQVSWVTSALGGAFSTCVSKIDDLGWQQWVRDYGRVYVSDSAEKRRYKIWLDNIEQIGIHNELYKRGQVSYSLKLNKFGDLTGLEFRQMMFGLPATTSTRHGSPFHSFSVLTNSPPTLDLRSRSVVTPVKDQGYEPLGGLFSAIGLLEGFLYRKTDQLIPLSEQQVIDCGNVAKNDKISFSKSMSFLSKEGAISQRDYPFEATKGECRSGGKKALVKFPQIRHVQPGDTKALEAVLDSVGPVSIQMPGNNKLQFYSAGVFNDLRKHRGKDFSALIVGYGSDKKYGDYWLVKNSWGDKWGERGYVKIAKRENDPLVTGLAHFPDFQCIWQQNCGS